MYLDLFAHNIVAIADSHFESGYTSDAGGGIAVYTHYTPQVSQDVQHDLVTVYINNTEFMGNHAEVGGAVAVSSAGTELLLYINGSKFHNNVADDGGHISFTLVSNHHTCANITITINNSLFEDGKASDGSGGGVAVGGDAQCSNGIHIYISSTEFVGNHVEFGPGGAVAILPCTVTQLYINASKFHKNIAGDGGHIAIMLSSTTQTCTNMTITINNSLFEDGKATNGGGGSGGGGIVVWGPANDYQCTNHNHISISNAQFERNHAENNGGAVLLRGCIGTEVYIDQSEFYNNTASVAGGHISREPLSGQIQFVINNTHFESGKAYTGAGIALISWNSFPSVSSTVHKSFYIVNSKFYQNVANYGGGIVFEFGKSCFSLSILIHNVSLSRNTATSSSGGSIYLQSTCSAGYSITISQSTVEYGNAGDSGGGMMVATNSSRTHACTLIMTLVCLKRTSISIVDSTFQYNTAQGLGGGLAIWFDSSAWVFCCNTEVNIINVTFLNNKVSIPASYDIQNPTSGGNIIIQDLSGVLNNSVRIHSCLIKGGLAVSGGGVKVIHSVKYAVFVQETTETEGLFISNTQFICNQATEDSAAAGASLDVEGDMLKKDSKAFNSLTPIIIRKIIIMNTTLDGTCAAHSSNVNVYGLRSALPYLPTVYSVVFINVSFQGYYAKSSSSLSTFYSHQLSDWALDDGFTQYTASPAMKFDSISNVTFLDCVFF